MVSRPCLRSVLRSPEKTEAMASTFALGYNRAMIAEAAQVVRASRFEL